MTTITGYQQDKEGVWIPKDRLRRSHCPFVSLYIFTSC